jgi:sulfopyruvate decarboxylase subunit alpha
VTGSEPHFEAIADGLVDWGAEAFVHVPSSHAAPVIRALQARGVRSLLANREEEAVGIAGGLALAGTRAAIVMQDNGFGNALTALATFAAAYHVPLPIFANTRGGPGEYNAMIHAFSDAVPDLLRALSIRTERLGPGGSPAVWRVTARAAADLAVIGRRPVVALFDALHPALRAEA